MILAPLQKPLGTDYEACTELTYLLRRLWSPGGRHPTFKVDYAYSPMGWSIIIKKANAGDWDPWYAAVRSDPQIAAARCIAMINSLVSQGHWTIID